MRCILYGNVNMRKTVVAIGLGSGKCEIVKQMRKLINSLVYILKTVDHIKESENSLERIEIL